MNRKKEILFGVLWGLSAAIILCLLMFGNVWSMAVEGEDGDIDISISADTVKIEMEKEGQIKSMTIDRDGIVRTATGISVENEVLIENGKIYIDGEELSEEELDRLSVDQEERSRHFGVTFGERDKPVVKRTRLATVYKDIGGDIVKFGDIVIADDERVSGDVVSIGGNIIVKGQVDGDVVSVFGDIDLGEDAYIRGDAAAPLGSIDRASGATVIGESVTRSRHRRKHHTNEATFESTARFNRVEGLTLVPGMRYKSDTGEYPTLELRGAYAFTLKRWEYDFRVSHKIGNTWGPKFTGSIYQTVSSSDFWLIPWEQENSFAAAMFKEDFLDYYWTRGFTGGGGLWYDDYLTLDVNYTSAKIETLERTAEKALFGGKKEFRENWSTVLYDSAAILGMEGNLKEVAVNAAYDTRDDAEDPMRGMYANLSTRQTVGSDSAGFDYGVVDGEFKWYYPLSHDQTLFARVRGGFSDDDLPLFRRYFIGGLGSLRGYDYKEFQGNRYVLLNMEYIWKFYQSDFGAGLFFDTGKAGFGKNGFEDADFKSAVGLSFIVSDVFRVNVAQRLDDIDKSPVFSLRGRILF